MKMSEVRAKFPMYSDMSDDQLLIGIRQKFYADIPMGEFSKRIEYDTERERLNPTKSMSSVERFVAGYGGAVPQIVRGVRQLLPEGMGGISQAEVDEAKRQDAPLMATGAGMAGNITGNIAAAIPTVAIPGAATLRGAAAVGAGMGFMQPVATGDSRLQNTAIGGAAGAGGVLVGRTLQAGAQGAKALVEPFTASGRDKIAGRMIQRFADDPARVAGTTNAPTITGARPTLAEQTGDAGLARLQDSLRSVDPQINNQISGRLSENNAARVNALRGMTGEDGAREFAVANRGATARQLYGDAFNVMPDAAALTAGQRREMVTLTRMPAVRDAMRAARAIGSNQGRNVGQANASGSIEGLHTMKLAMDDAIQAASGGTAAQANKAASIRSARDRLVEFIEELSPDYRAARTTYAQMSKPINAMDTAAEVARRGLSNGSDLSGNPTINRNALLGSLRDEPALMKRATGRNVGNTLSDVMEPDQLAMLRSIASETDRAGAVATAGNGPGSATAQRMASQNILRQIVGPTGLPQSWAESALANTVIGKPFNLIYGGVAEPKIQQALAQAVLDPARAQEMMRLAKTLPPQQRNALLQMIQQAAAQGARSAPPAIALDR